MPNYLEILNFMKFEFFAFEKKKIHKFAVECVGPLSFTLAHDLHLINYGFDSELLIYHN